MGTFIEIGYHELQILEKELVIHDEETQMSTQALMHEHQLAQLQQSNSQPESRQLICLTKKRAASMQKKSYKLTMRLLKERRRTIDVTSWRTGRLLS